MSTTKDLVRKAVNVSNAWKPYPSFTMGGSKYYLYPVSNTETWVVGQKSKECEGMSLPYYATSDGWVVANTLTKVEGFENAEHLPYLYITWAKEMTVMSDAVAVTTLKTSKRVFKLAVRVYAKAVELPLKGCEACAYYSGEACLPCGVNPMQYPNWAECRDYEAK